MTFKCEGERNDHLLHYEQVFDNVFERRESKCYGVLMKHRHKVKDEQVITIQMAQCYEVLIKRRRKVKGEQVITVQMAQQLKTKNISVMPGQLFRGQCKAKFLLEIETHCTDDEYNVQFVTDTDNEFTEFQTSRKKLQSIGISPATLQVVSQHSQITNAKMKLDKVMKTIKNNISEVYKVQVDCLENSEPDSFDKNDRKEKANELVRLHKAMQEKLKTPTFLETIKIFTLVPDKWSQKYCSECFNVFEYLA